MKNEKNYVGSLMSKKRAGGGEKIFQKKSRLFQPLSKVKKKWDHLRYFSIFRALCVYKNQEEPKPKYICRVRTYILALCLKHFQEKISNILRNL